MSDIDDPFESPRLLVEGAERHIVAFEQRLLTIQAERSAWAEPVAGADGSMIIRTSVTLPSDLKQLVFDITNNLRSALDHAVYGSTYALIGWEGDGTKFPFGEDATDLRGNIKRACKRVPTEMAEFLASFEAHQHGNPLLWGLNKLRNTKSHRILLPCAAAPMLSGMGEPQNVTVEPEFDPTTGRFDGRVQLVPGAKMGGVIFAFRLTALIGTGKFRGEPATRVFRALLGEVQRVVAAIEAETARLLSERS